MKKKIKKLNISAKQPTEGINRDHIRYLGFVVDSKAEGHKKLSHALVSLQQTPDFLYVIELSPDRYGIDSKDSVGRYFRTIFSVVIKTLIKYEAEGKLEYKTTILSSNKELYINIGKALRDWAYSNKVTSVSKDFPKIRKAIHNSILAASGVYPDIKTVWKGDNVPENIFFWSLQTLQNSILKGQDYEPIQIYEIHEFNPKTEIEHVALHSLVKTIIYTDYGNTWQHLYLSAICNISEPEDWINIQANILDRTNNKKEQLIQTQNSSIDLCDPLQFINNETRAIILGRSGSGKTTILKKLAKELCNDEIFLEDNMTMPVIIPLAGFGMDNESNLSSAIYTAIIQVFNNLPISKLFGWNKSRKYVFQNDSVKDDIIREISQDIQTWLHDERNLLNLVLLLDGYSDVSFIYEHKLLEEMKLFLSKVRGCVISTKNVVLQLHEDLGLQYQLELQPLCDKQILEFIKKKCPKPAGSLLSNLEVNYPRVYELIQVPFYLYIYRELLIKNDSIEFEVGEGKLIEYFIKKMILGKIDSKEVSLSIDIATFTYAMSVIAHLIYINITSNCAPYLKYPEDFINSYLSLTNWREILKLGAKIGIINDSGQHFNNSLSFSKICFGHDLFRDFFAAKWILSQSKDYLMSEDFTNSSLEYKIWDNPLKMYVEIEENENQTLDEFVLKIGHCDPYLATRCVELRSDWKEETIWEIFKNLKYWELDIIQTSERPFSVKGVQCTEILLNKLTKEKFFSLMPEDSHYSLEYIKLPKVFFEKYISTHPFLILRLISLYKDYPLHFIEGLSDLMEYKYFELTIGLISELLALNETKLWSDLSYKFMSLIHSSKYTPVSADLESLLPLIKNNFIKQIVFFKIKHTEEELKELLNNNDDILKAVAAFKLSYKPEDDFELFLRQIEKFDYHHLNNPLFYHLITIVVHSSPNKMSHILFTWLNDLMKIGYPSPEIFRILELLLCCENSLSYQKIIQVLCEADLELVRKIIQGEVNGIISKQSRVELIRGFKCISSEASYKRILFLRFALGDNLTPSEMENFEQIFFKSYNEAIEQSSSVSGEFLFNLTCLLKRKTNHTTILENIDKDFLDQSPQYILQSIKLYKEIDLLSSILTRGLEEDMDLSIKMLIDNSYILSHQKCEAVCNILYDPLFSNQSIESFIKHLWNHVYQLLEKEQFLNAFKLVYIYREIERITQHRWISIRGFNPWAELKKNISI